jgi:hypothetical protein
LSNRDAGRRFLLGEVSLEDYFFSENQAADVFAAIQYKMVGAMLKAENSKGRRTGAEHYISGVNDRISSLTRRLMPDIKGLDQVFGFKDLPRYVLQLDRSQQRRVLDNLHFEVVSAILVMLRNKGHLYYMAGHGDWLFSDFICRVHNHAAREARQAWRDERSWHGRPSKQGRQRSSQLGTAPGVSIGGYAASS